MSDRNVAEGGGMNRDTTSKGASASGGIDPFTHMITFILRTQLGGEIPRIIPEEGR